MGCMHLDHVKAGFFGPVDGIHMKLLDVIHVVSGHRFGHGTVAVEGDGACGEERPLLVLW